MTESDEITLINAFLPDKDIVQMLWIISLLIISKPYRELFRNLVGLLWLYRWTRKGSLLRGADVLIMNGISCLMSTLRAKVSSVMNGKYFFRLYQLLADRSCIQHTTSFSMFLHQRFPRHNSAQTVIVFLKILPILNAKLVFKKTKLSFSLLII